MVLGQSVGRAASLILEQGIAVQDLDYKILETKLIDGGQVLKPLQSSFN